MIISYLFFPTIIFGSLKIHKIFLIENCFVYNLFLTSIISFFVMGITFYFENKIPYKKEWKPCKEELIDDFFIFIRLSIISLFTSILIPNNIINFCPKKIKKSNLYIQLTFTTLFSELGFYIIHRIQHNYKIKSHKYHHKIDKLYFLNSGKFSVQDIIIDTLFQIIPVKMIMPSVNIL